MVGIQWPHCIPTTPEHAVGLQLPVFLLFLFDTTDGNCSPITPRGHMLPPTAVTHTNKDDKQNSTLLSMGGKNSLLLFLIFAKLGFFSSLSD